MSTPIIIVSKFDVFANTDGIKAVWEIGNNDWSRRVRYRGYDYTLLVSNRFTNPRIEAMRNQKKDKAKQHSLVNRWTVGATLNAWDADVDDPLGFGRISMDNVHVIYYPLGVEAVPCVAIGWIESLEIANRTHVRLKMRGYQEDPTYAILCDLADIFLDELAGYGIECRFSGDSPSATGEGKISIEQYIENQTNIAGNAKGPVASGKFESATAFGEGDAKDCREQEGD